MDGVVSALSVRGLTLEQARVIVHDIMKWKGMIMECEVVVE